MTDNETLKKHLSGMATYDLNRLKQCFLYSKKYEPENRERIEDILEHIDHVLKDRQ